MNPPKLTMVSLFSGAMGLDIGLESTGSFSLLCAIEKQPAFQKTIAANIRAGRIGNPDTILLGDINDVDPRELRERLGLARGELDVLVGGPPCQSFSTAGRRRTVLDPRGTLLWRFIDFVEEFQPRLFLMENVRGLVSAALRHRPIAERPNSGGPSLSPDEEPSSVLRKFTADLHERTDGQYILDGFEVNSVNYGSPQIRERLLVFGNRLNIRIEFPEPTHGSPVEVETSSLGQQTSMFSKPPLQPWSTLREAIGDLEDSTPELLDFSPRKKGFLKLVPPGGNWRSLPEETQRESMGKAFHAKGGRSGWWRRLTFDLPTPTIMTMPNHASTSLCHPTETRALSVREYQRIQEFPDDWEFVGSVSERYRQIGNAVPVRLGAVAGRLIGEVLSRSTTASVASSESLEAPESGALRLVYLKSHVRTRQWFKNGAAAVWDQDPTAKSSKVRYASAKTIRRERFL